MPLKLSALSWRTAYILTSLPKLKREVYSHCCWFRTLLLSGQMPRDWDSTFSVSTWKALLTIQAVALFRIFLQVMPGNRKNPFSFYYQSGLSRWANRNQKVGEKLLPLSTLEIRWISLSVIQGSPTFWGPLEKLLWPPLAHPANEHRSITYSITIISSLFSLSRGHLWVPGMACVGPCIL